MKEAKTSRKNKYITAVIKHLILFIANLKPRNQQQIPVPQKGTLYCLRLHNYHYFVLYRDV